ncbi:hypothetical protein OK074_6105, partial [Actinobacteria bacterium OK074]
MVTRLADGVSAVTVIHGAPGSGRSRLLRRGTAFARAVDVQVLTALGAARSARTPYAFVRQLRPSRSGGGGPALPAESGAGSVQGWCRALLAAAHRPTLLALDDVQWADPESVQVVRALLRRLAPAPLALLLTVTSARGEFPDACAALLDQAAMFQDGQGLLLELGPLSGPEVRAVCAAAELPAPAPVDDVWWERAARLSRGNPGLLRRTLDELRRTPGEGSAADLRAAFAQGVGTAGAELAAESAARLAPGPLALLRGIAVCRGLVAVDRVAELVGVDGGELPVALRTLRVQGLVDFGAPPRLRLGGCTAWLLGGLDGDERKRLHAEAARWAHRCDADEAELAALLLSTVPLGEPWVPWVLRRTARHLQARGRHAAAAELLDRALREPLDAQARAEVLLEAAEAYTIIAPEAAARRIAALPAGPQAGPRLRTAAADLLLAHGTSRVAPGVVAALCGERGPDVPEGARATGRTVAQAPPILVGPEVPMAALARAAWRQTERGEDAAAVRDMCRQVLRAPLDGALFPRLIACWTLSFTDREEEARDALDAALAEAGRRHSPALVAPGLLLRAQLSLRAGDPGTAAHDLAACRALVPVEVWHPSRLISLRAVQVQLLVVQERYDEAARLAAAELPPGAEQADSWIHLVYARAQLLLCQGRPQQALAEAEECGRRLAARGCANPALVPWRSLAALALLGCGDGARAEALFTEELRLAERWGTDSALGWTELRRGFGSPSPQAARLTDRALRRLGRTPTTRRYAQSMVARETAVLRRGVGVSWPGV